MTTDPAVTAAAEALHATNDIEQDDYGRAWFADPEATAARLVAAARPIIEAEVRERIAAEQAAWECDDPWTCCVAAHRDIARQRERGQS